MQINQINDNNRTPVTVSAENIAAKHGGEKLVLLASRRTDLPRFYTGDIIRGLSEGEFICKPPMHKPFRLQFSPRNIHSIGMWSQDFSEWIRRFPEIEHAGYRFWYRFTILPDHPFFKPVAPSVDLQLEQIGQIASLPGHSSKQIKVYVDPLIMYRIMTGSGEATEWQKNYSIPKLHAIFGKLTEHGIEEVTISVIDCYSKVKRRTTVAGYEINFFDGAAGDMNSMMDLIGPFILTAGQYGLKVKSCCEKKLTAAGITEQGACVEGSWLNKVFGPGASSQRDTGQRMKYGCGCSKSLDIGSYNSACGHNCPQCYARRG